MLFTRLRWGYCLERLAGLAVALLTAHAVALVCLIHSLFWANAKALIVSPPDAFLPVVTPGGLRPVISSLPKDKKFNVQLHDHVFELVKHDTIEDIVLPPTCSHGYFCPTTPCHMLGQSNMYTAHKSHVGTIKHVYGTQTAC